MLGVTPGVPLLKSRGIVSPEWELLLGGLGGVVPAFENPIRFFFCLIIILDKGGGRAQ